MLNCFLAAQKLRHSGLAITFLFCPVLFEVSVAQTPEAVFRSQTQVVTVPTLVTTKSGDLIYGLTAKDFIITDDGVDQEIHLDDSPEAEAISLVVAIQVGRSAPLQFKGREDPSLSKMEREDCRLKRYPCPTTISGIGTMLESLVGAKGELAVVTFDSQVRVFQNFTTEFDNVSKRLKTLSPGDGGAAILDAVSYSLRMLDKRPKSQRKIFLLISESRDHGSRLATLEDVALRLGTSNITTYSMAFSPSRAELLRDVKGDGPGGDKANLLPPLAMSMQAMRKNVARAVAEMSGGEYEMFKDKRTFDSKLGSAANHVRNCYQLSFHPKSPKPGPHVINVRLRSPLRDVIVASRNRYWAIGTVN